MKNYPPDTQGRNTMIEILEKENTLTECFANLLGIIGEDVNREGLRLTPQRAAKSMRYLTKGYKDVV